MLVLPQISTNLDVNYKSIVESYLYLYDIDVNTIIELTKFINMFSLMKNIYII